MDPANQHLAQPSPWRMYLAGAVAVLLILAMGAHLLSTLGEAVRALGALLNNDAHYEPFSASYKVWYAVGIAAVAATAALMLMWFRDARQNKGKETDPSRLSGLPSIQRLCWGMLILGALISSVGFVMVAKTADAHAGETLSPANRLGADMILRGAVIDILGSLVVLVGSFCCLLLLRSWSQARTAASTETASMV
jgi:hypothetical protein